MRQPKSVQRSAADFSSRRLQLIAIGAVLLVALLVGLVSLGQAKPRITGNNGVPPDVFVTTLTPANGPLCTSGVSVPEETVGIRLWLGTYHVDGVKVTMTTRGPDGRALGKSTPTFDDGDRVIFELPAGARENLTLCWTTTKANIAVPGQQNGNANPDQVSVVGKKPVPGDISIEYMRANEESAIAAAPTVFERASLFRPSWVGPWTYWAIFLVALITLFAGILLLLAAGRDTERLKKRTVAAVAAIAFVNAALWALVTPAFNTPDELSHFTYVETLASGQMPQDTLSSSKDPGNSYLPSTVYAGDVTARNIIQHRFIKEPWSKSEEAEFEKNYDVIKNGPDAHYGLTPAKVYTPVYYLPAVAGYEIGSLGNIFDKLYFVRLWSALLLAIGVAFVVLFVREMIPRYRWAPPIAGLAAAYLPMAAHLGGAVTNDNLMVAACAAALYCGARLLRRGVTFWPAFGAMIATVLGYSAKPTALGIAPAIAFALLVAIWRSKERWPALRTTVLAGIAPVVILAALYAAFGGGGSVDLSGTGTAPLRPATPTGFLSYLWQWYLPSIGSMDEYWVGIPPAFRVFFGGFLADFNSLDTNFPDIFYKLMMFAALALFLLVLRAVWVRRADAKAQWPLIVFPALAVLGTLALIHVTGYLLWAQDAQVFAQGRYLFPALGVFALYVVVAGIGSGKRTAIPLASAVVVTLACVNIAGMILSLGRFYL